MTDELVSIKTVTVVAGRSAGDENPVLGGKKVVIELVPASYKASERDHYLVRHTHTHTHSCEYFSFCLGIVRLIEVRVSTQVTQLHANHWACQCIILSVL